MNLAFFSPSHAPSGKINHEKFLSSFLIHSPKKIKFTPHKKIEKNQIKITQKKARTHFHMQLAARAHCYYIFVSLARANREVPAHDDDDDDVEWFI
jgi:hypothetical protein